MLVRSAARWLTTAISRRFHIRWAALSPGINVLNDGDASGAHIAVKGTYHSGFRGTLYETIEEAILKETQKSLRDQVRIHFLNDGSRKLAEKYFNARKPT